MQKTSCILLITTLLLTSRLFAQTTYSSAGKMAIFKADSILYHHSGDSDLTVKTTIRAISPSKNHRSSFKGTGEGNIYRLKDQVIKVVYMKSYNDNLGPDQPVKKKQDVHHILFKRQAFLCRFLSFRKDSNRNGLHCLF